MAITNVAAAGSFNGTNPNTISLTPGTASIVIVGMTGEDAVMAVSSLTWRGADIIAGLAPLASDAGTNDGAFIAASLSVGGSGAGNFVANLGQNARGMAVASFSGATGFTGIASVEQAAGTTSVSIPAGITVNANDRMLSMIIFRGQGSQTLTAGAGASILVDTTGSSKHRYMLLGDAGVSTLLGTISSSVGYMAATLLLQESAASATGAMTQHLRNMGAM